MLLFSISHAVLKNAYLKKNLKAKLTQNIEIVRKNKDCVTKKNAKNFMKRQLNSIYGWNASAQYTVYIIHRVSTCFVTS